MRGKQVIKLTSWNEDSSGLYVIEHSRAHKALSQMLLPEPLTASQDAEVPIYAPMSQASKLGLRAVRITRLAGVELRFSLQAPSSSFFHPARAGARGGGALGTGVWAIGCKAQCGLGSPTVAFRCRCCHLQADEHREDTGFCLTVSFCKWGYGCPNGIVW